MGMFPSRRESSGSVEKRGIRGWKGEHPGLDVMILRSQLDQKGSSTRVQSDEKRRRAKRKGVDLTILNRAIRAARSGKTTYEHQLPSEVTNVVRASLTRSSCGSKPCILRSV